MKCAKCQHENPPRAKFCIECAAKLARACANCGSELPPAAKFCPECAHPAESAAEQGETPRSVVPRHLAERILESRTAIEGERKQVTVLFADMKGSLELLADRDPEEARQILDPVLERMMEAVHRFEGTVNQVMGDGIMALFGAPLAHEDHAVRACYAALRLQESIGRYTHEIRRTHGVEVQVRVGLNSGDVVVRSIGSDLRMDYSAVGRTTSLAARMEQLAAPGTTRLTAATLTLAEGYVQVKSLGPIPVKGVPEPVEVFELIGAADARTRLQARRAYGLVRFVGRDAEMQQLQQAAVEARGGRGQIVAVVGEAGVGKSRLYYEFTRSHHVQGWTVLQASSVSYGKATAFLPLVELLRAYFRIDAGDDLRTIRGKVTGALLTLDEALRDAVPAALWLLDALPEDSPFAALDSGQRRWAALDGLKRLVLRESQVQPVLVVFEDLHWIDSETQAFLDMLAASLPASAVLLAVNFRPEYQHGWAGKTYYRQLRIDPLGAHGAEELLAELLGADASTAALKPLLAERTQGNPLYIEESVRSLVEMGALVGTKGAYRLVGDLGALSIPASVRSILAARVDRLGTEDKRLLQAAAVVGMDVPYALLREIAGLPEDDLRAGLARLQSAEFLYEAKLFPNLEFTFHHALTHDVAYEGMLQERRRALHGAIVEAAERLLGDEDVTPYVERLAHHAARAEAPAKAVHYLRLAATKAAARFANKEALSYFEQALALLDADPTPENRSQALDLRIAMGSPLMASMGENAPEVQALYLRLRDEVEKLGDTQRRFPVLWGLWRAAFSSARFAEACERGEQLLSSANRGSDDGKILEAHHTLWPTLTALGRARDALSHIERGVALYDFERHASLAALYSGHDPGTCCYTHMSMTQWILGRPEGAIVALDQAQRLGERVRQPMSSVFISLTAAWIHYQRGEMHEAAMHARNVKALCERYEIAGLTAPAEVIECATGGDASEERLDALEAASMSATAWRRTFCLVVIAELHAKRARTQAARGALGRIAVSERDALYASEIERLEGEICLREPQPAIDAAEGHFRRACKIAREREALSFELRAATGLARALERQGRHTEAREALSPVFARFTEGLDTGDLKAARAVLDALPA